MKAERKNEIKALLDCLGAGFCLGVFGFYAGAFWDNAGVVYYCLDCGIVDFFIFGLWGFVSVWIYKIIEIIKANKKGANND